MSERKERGGTLYIARKGADEVEVHAVDSRRKAGQILGNPEEHEKLAAEMFEKKERDVAVITNVYEDGMVESKKVSTKVGK